MPLITAGNSEAAVMQYEIFTATRLCPLQQQLTARWCAGMGIRVKTGTPEAIFEPMRAAASEEWLRVRQTH